MKKYIFLRAYLNENLGDDLFVNIIAKRYSIWHFLIFEKNTYRSKFPENVQFILDKSMKYKFDKQRALYILARKNKILRHFLLDCFLPENRLKNKIIKESFANVYIIGSGFIEGGKIGLNYYLNEKAFFSHSAYLLGCNFGPFYSVNYIRIHQRLFSKTKDICFRDSYSFNLFSKLQQTRFEADIVFTYNDGEKDIPGIYKNYVLISVVNLEKDQNIKCDKDNYINFICRLAKYLILKGKEVIFVGFCKNQNDDVSILEIYNRLDFYEKKHVSMFNYPEIEYKCVMWLFKNADAVIASRYHAVIIGMLYRVKTYILSYSDKTANVLKDIDSNIKYVDVTNNINISIEQFWKSYGYLISESKLLELKTSAERQFSMLDKKLDKIYKL